ncbi:hypothetical protein HLK59_20500 [Streptomyces sp. S3(2020)]|uniref:hypothetical protein n=1 Tax=Streptomyces sp. S3(2020) TaxID=2732044 RepID=UPI001487EFD4|nr:hypothetical protein [Streptomyces sp. S3(2020)]NNN32701.1 hypothetical protein [Streptomyces sp. S3(2020)]
MAEGTRQAAQAMYRLMRTIEASCSDPRTRAEVEALQHALPADAELAVHEIPLIASNLTRAAAELDAARIAVNLSGTQLWAAVRELYPDLILPEPDRCQAAGDRADGCEGLEDAVLLVPASGPAVTACVHHAAAAHAQLPGCRVERGPGYRSPRGLRWDGGVCFCRRGPDGEVAVEG